MFLKSPGIRKSDGRIHLPSPLSTHVGLASSLVREEILIITKWVDRPIKSITSAATWTGRTTFFSKLWSSSLLPIPMAVPRQVMVTMFRKIVTESRALLSIQRIVATIDANSYVGTLAIVPIYLAVGMNNANAISANASPKRMRQQTQYNMVAIFL